MMCFANTAADLYSLIVLQLGLSLGRTW